MADIAFLLIIFFLVTTSFNQEMGLSLTLPPVSDQAEQIQVRQKNIVNIWVNAVGEILLAEEIVSLQQIEPEIRRRAGRSRTTWNKNSVKLKPAAISTGLFRGRPNL